MKYHIRFRPPTRPQQKLTASTKRFNYGVWGRQSGKTTWGIEKMLWKPQQGPKQAIYWYVLQTWPAAEVAFRRYMDFYRQAPGLFEERPNQSDLRFRLRGSDRYVFFKSGENYQDMRIETLDGAIVDEYRQQHPTIWSEIIRPMLAKKKGWGDVLTTPNGFDHSYDLYEEALGNPEEWGVVHAPSTEAWWWTPAEILSAKRAMSEALFAQEILAEFRDMMKGKAYLSHGQHNQLLQTPFMTSDPELLVSDKYPIVLGCDFNLNPMSWHLGQTDKLKWYWFDEIHLQNSHTPEAAKELIERLHLIQVRGLMRSQPQLVICGDATGAAGQRAAAAQSDYDVLLRALKKANFSYRNETPAANPRIKDRIQTMNSHLRSADGFTTFYYHPIKCPKLKRDFDRVTWKGEGILDEGTDKQLTHSSDSVGYPVTKMTPLKSIKEVGKARVIVRT